MLDRGSGVECLTGGFVSALGGRPSVAMRLLIYSGQGYFGRPGGGGRRRLRLKNESRNLVFSPSRSNLGLVSSRFAGFVRNREIYKLGMVSRPALFKIKGKT